MPVRHRLRGRLTLRGITSRRLAAASRALQRERDRLPLFADQVVAEQLTPSERIEHHDEQLLAYEHRHRDLSAQHWRWARRQLQQLPDELHEAIVAKWNVSTIPPDAAYFADFVRRELRRLNLEP